MPSQCKYVLLHCLCKKRNQWINFFLFNGMGSSNVIGNRNVCVVPFCTFPMRHCQAVVAEQFIALVAMHICFVLVAAFAPGSCCFRCCYRRCRRFRSGLCWCVPCQCKGKVDVSNRLVLETNHKGWWRKFPTACNLSTAKSARDPLPHHLKHKLCRSDKTEAQAFSAAILSANAFSFAAFSAADFCAAARCAAAWRAASVIAFSAAARSAAAFSRVAFVCAVRSFATFAATALASAAKAAPSDDTDAVAGAGAADAVADAAADAAAHVAAVVAAAISCACTKVVMVACAASRDMSDAR
jgi:hypothetical protein